MGKSCIRIIKQIFFVLWGAYLCMQGRCCSCSLPGLTCYLDRFLHFRFSGTSETPILEKVDRFGFSFVLSGLDLGVDFCFFRDFREFRILGVPYSRQVGVFFSKMSIFAIFNVFGHFFQNLRHFNLQTRGKFFSDYMQLITGFWGFSNPPCLRGGFPDLGDLGCPKVKKFFYFTSYRELWNPGSDPTGFRDIRVNN